MNRDWYRMVVRSVRWSPEKRAEIIKRLQESEAEWDDALDISHELPDDDWEKELNDPDVAYRKQRIEMIETREYEMKQRRMRRILTIGLLAATLATGGAIGAAVAYAKKHPQTLNITWKNGIILNLTDEETDEPFGNNYYPNPNFSGYDETITETDTGWFYRKVVMDEAPDESLNMYGWWGRDGIPTLYYMDEETGITVPVCARANCLHDATEYCTATTPVYGYSYLTYYEGYLYAMTTKYLHPEARYNYNQIEGIGTGDSSRDECRQVLLRISPDGTEITELADFGAGVGATKCIVHRGYIWCIVQRQVEGEAYEHPITHQMTSFVSGGWQLWGYELATGKSATLFDAVGDPTIDHTNRAPQNLMASGDYIYFERQDGDWSGAQGLCRLSLLTGEITNGEEEVLITGRHLTCMSKTHALRSKEIRLENGEKAWEEYLLNLETREEVLLGNSEEFRKLASTDELKFDAVSITKMNNNYLFATGRKENRITGNIQDDYLFIFDYEGNLLKTVKTGFENVDFAKTEKGENGYDYRRVFYEYVSIAAVTDERVYIEHTVGGTLDELEERGKERLNQILYCSIDSLLNDETPDWQLAYSNDMEVRGNAQ